MDKLYGYVGKIARINLTTSTVTDIPTSNYVPEYLGGRGVCTKIFWDEVGPEVKAFDPENKIILMTGPTTGTGIPTGGRTSLGGLSPNSLPEQYAWGSIGGWFGATLKFAGYDGFIIEGKAAEPTYIFINDGKITFHSAKELWGMLVHQTQRKLEEILGKDIDSLVIGPAGENLVRNASITTSNDNVAAKSGFGAVWGSKNLKAISVRGTGSVIPADIKKVLELRKTMGWPAYRLNPIEESDYFNVRPHIQFPLKDQTYKKTHVACSHGCNQHCNLMFIDAKAGIGGDENGRTNLVNKCVGVYSFKMIEDCGWTPSMSFMTEKHHYQANKSFSEDFYEKDMSDPAIEHGFFERHVGDTMNLWEGSYDRGSVVSDLCTQYGIDRWDVVIWYMTWLAMAKKEGVLDDIDFGMEVDVESEEFLKYFLDMITYRKGYYGNLFAEGMARALRVLGIEKYGKTIYTGRTSNRVPGLKIPIPISFESAWGHCYHWVGRGFQSTADITSWLPCVLTLLTSTRDAQTNTHHHDDFSLMLECQNDPCHNPRIAASAIYSENKTELKESITSCDWQSPNVYWNDMECQMFEAATGIKMTVEEMNLAAERLKNLFRAILIRNYGRTREMEVNEVYPCLTYPDAEGRTVAYDDFNDLVTMYYEQRGWDVETGWPTRETYEKCGLGYVADELEALGKLPKKK